MGQMAHARAMKILVPTLRFCGARLQVSSAKTSLTLLPAG
jgi:hypothetical protein